MAKPGKKSPKKIVVTHDRTPEKRETHAEIAARARVNLQAKLDDLLPNLQRVSVPVAELKAVLGREEATPRLEISVLPGVFVVRLHLPGGKIVARSWHSTESGAQADQKGSWRDEIVRKAGLAVSNSLCEKLFELDVELSDTMQALQDEFSSDFDR